MRDIVTDEQRRRGAEWGHPFQSGFAALERGDTWRRGRALLGGIFVAYRLQAPGLPFGAWACSARAKRVPLAHGTPLRSSMAHQNRPAKTSPISRSQH